MAFDPTLVRGMSIIPVRSSRSQWMSSAASVGGGGRYDEMIGKFTGNIYLACGFSIGFERIVMLLLERGYQNSGASEEKAYLIEKKYPADKLLEILKQAKEERKNGQQVNISL